MTISISKSLYSLIVRTELIKKYNTLKFCRVTIYGVLFCRATFCHATVLIDLTAFNTSCAPLNTYYFWVVGVGGGLHTNYFRYWMRGLPTSGTIALARWSTSFTILSYKKYKIAAKNFFCEEKRVYAFLCKESIY